MTFQSFVFGCRVNEAERIKIDKSLIEAGFRVDLASPGFLIINTCAITGKAEREAKQLIYQLRRKHPQARIVLTGCSATLWKKYSTEDKDLADLNVPNDRKSSLINLLHTLALEPLNSSQPLLTASINRHQVDKFRHSNRLLVKIQDGCHRFCAYCIVPYLRGRPLSERIADLISYIQSYSPMPSEVVLSAINTEAFGNDTGESLTSLIQGVLKETKVSRIALGSLHPWSLTKEFVSYYQSSLAHDQRFVSFFHVPIQSGSQTVLGYMKREYNIHDVIRQLSLISKVQPHAFIATDVIAGFLGETDDLFEESYTLLKNSNISRFHVFRFSNRAHTAAFYLKKRLPEPTSAQKKERSKRLIELSKIKYLKFIDSLVGRSFQALVIAEQTKGVSVLLSNHVEGILEVKHRLPGQIVHVTIMGTKDSLVICKES